MGPGEWRWGRRTGKQGSGPTDGHTCCPERASCTRAVPSPGCPGRALPLHMLWFSVSWAHGAMGGVPRRHSYKDGNVVPQQSTQGT